MKMNEIIGSFTLPEQNELRGMLRLMINNNIQADEILDLAKLGKGCCCTRFYTKDTIFIFDDERSAWFSVPRNPPEKKHGKIS